MSFFKKPEEEIVAIFDIGNGSVGGALVKLTRHGVPVIIYSHREPLAFAPTPSAKYLMSSMLKMLKNVSENLTTEGMKRVKMSIFESHKLKDAYCIFASPWYMSQTKIINEKKDSPFTVHSGTMNELVKKEQEHFNSEINEGKYEQIFGPDTILLEKKIINVKLNGYEIHNPIGKQAREMELTLFSSFISKEIISEVEETIHKAFSVRSISHSSYGFVYWNASKILFSDIHNYFFLDISNETTDASLVEQDLLIETISFPMGRSALLRALVKDLNITPEVAVSSLSMHLAGHADDKFKGKIDNSVNPVIDKWYNSLVDSLKKFQKIYALPKAALVTVDLDVSKLFLNALSRELPAELNIVDSKLSAILVGADTVQKFIEINSGANPDSFIAIESIFFNRLFCSQNN